ncbi:unnamed protein product [Brassica oleracea var. botrytis]
MSRRLKAYLISILLIMAVSPPSHGLSLGGLSIGQVEINGIARCSLNGDPNAPPISNGTTNVLTCGGLTANLAETLTQPNGFFLMFLSFLQTLLFTPSSCYITINLPAGNCSIYSPDGVLSAVLTLASVAVGNNTNVASFVAGPMLDNIF